jgi:hypothetical protein
VTATSPATNRAAAVAVETGAATAAEATAEEEAVADKSATNVSIPLLLRRIVTDNTQVARSVISLVRARRLVAIATAAADVVEATVVDAAEGMVLEEDKVVARPAT